jgi:hypothetical protein
MESVTLQGLDVPTKTVAIGPLGLSLSEAMIAWQLPPLSALAEENVDAKSPNQSEQVRVASIEFVLQELSGLTTTEGNSLPTPSSIDNLSDNLQRSLTKMDMQRLAENASKGLLSYLESARPALEKLRTVLNGLTIGNPQLTQDAIAALDAKRFDELAGLIQQIAIASPLQVALKPYISMSPEDFVSLSGERDKFAMMLLLAQGGEVVKTMLDKHYQVFDLATHGNQAIMDLEASRRQLEKELSQMIGKENIDVKWSAKGIAWQSVVDPEFRKELSTLLNGVRGESLATWNAKGIGMRGQSEPSPQDDYMVVVCKTDGTQSILSVSAARCSAMGGIQLSDRDRVLMLRWDDIRLGNADDRYTFAEVQSKTEQFRQEWHNVAVVDTSFLGRAAQVYLPMGTRTKGYIPSQPFIPSDATFTYGHCQALPIMVRGELQRRVRNASSASRALAN